jgi:hypothetical protein
VDRHRCARCRNAIRSARPMCVHAVPEPLWFHPDCWAEDRAAKQQDYREQAEGLGLCALLAPYGAPGRTLEVPVTLEEAAAG